MKNLLKRIVTFALALVLAAGCFAVPAMADSYEFDTAVKTYEKTYTRSSDGVVYKTISYQYPVFTGTNKTAVKKLNSFYTKLKKNWLTAAKKNLKKAKKAAVKDCCYSDIVDCKVTYIDRMYVCVYQTREVYMMGAHGTHYRICHVFNVNTGKEVSAATLMGLSSKSKVNTKVRALFAAQYKGYKNTESNPYYVFASSLKKFKKELKKIDFSKRFYINDDGKLVFYADEQTLAPYAAGFSEVTTDWTYPTKNYTGLKDGTSDYCTLKMVTVGKDTYDTEIGIYRLVDLVGVTSKENGKLVFEDSEHGIKGTITIKSKKATFKVTSSDWKLLEKGSAFTFKLK